MSKIYFIQPYIEAALKETPSRSTVAKGPTMQRRNSTRRLSARNSGVPMTMDSLLDLFSYQTLANLPDHIVQSLLIPHQKYSLNNFASEETRSIKFDSNAIPDMTVLKSVYGIIVNQLDAARAPEEGDITSTVSATPFVGNAESAPALYSAQTNNPGNSPALRRGTSAVASGNTLTFDQMNDNVSSIAEVQSVLAKIKALRIPPLSPDFGTLNQPSDGRPYR